MSNVRQFVEREANRETTDVGRMFRDRRVTVRLSGSEYGALCLIAQRLGSSPTGCGQALLEHAIEDALQALGYEDWAAAQLDVVSALQHMEYPSVEVIE